MARGATVALNTVPERVSVLEVKVENIDGKLDELKVDVKDMHDCLDRTRDSVMEKLECMTAEYRTNAAKYYEHADNLNAQQTAQHNELAGKIKELEQFKQKWVYMVAGGIAVAGFITGHFEKFIGLIK